jgi:N-acyl-phosphatidylethanolamine-hydrolysing phospholipase D
VILVALAVPGSTMPDAESGESRPAHHRPGGFRNLDPGYSYPISGRIAHLVLDRFESSPERGAALRPRPNDGRALRENGSAPTLTWVGHSTFLLQVDGIHILTDPTWADRASPVDFAGPRRLVPPGLRFEDLPPIHAVIISHDHYDHLDAPTVARLAREHAPRFFVPLGLRAWLADRGIHDVVELDWWEAASFQGLTIACTPAQHSSGRGAHDQNRRLWASWVVWGSSRRFFFAGDTGYYPGFKEIGRRFGPFDVAAIPIGGYASYAGRHPNHVNPEEALQILEDIQGRLIVPMHWGTFALNREPFREPPDRLAAEAARRGIEERVTVLDPGQTLHW